MGKGKALVTGATGFIGSYLICALLERGYHVRGSVQNKADSAKLAPLKAFPHQENLEIVEADLLKPASWDSVVQSCDFVFHVAAQITFKTAEDVEKMITSIVDGTSAILKAAAKYDVKAVIITSSVATMYDFSHPGKVFTEEDWVDPLAKETMGYAKGKLSMEKAAMEFWESTGRKFKLSILNPVTVLGPTKVSKPFWSASVVIPLLDGSTKEMCQISMPLVDIRDVVEAEIRALELPISNGRRYICASGESPSIKNMADILREEFSKHGRDVSNIPVVEMKECPYTGENSENNVMRVGWGKVSLVSNERAKKELGMTFRSAKEAIIGMAHSLIELGVVPDLPLLSSAAKK